jgi:CRP-like cAMP-binding protein
MKQESICSICKCRIGDNAFFANLSDRELHVFKDAVIMNSFPRKNSIFMEGDGCKGFYVVRTGRIKLTRTSRDGKEQIIKILGPGDLFGFETFYDGKNYDNNAVAMEDSEVCFVGKREFFSIVDTHPGIAVKLMVSLSRELHDAYERIGTLGLMNAKERLSHLLYTLAVEYGVSEKKGVRLHLPLSRLEIAELLGITQETSIRLLKALKESGMIDIKRKEIVITSMEKLAALSGQI